MRVGDAERHAVVDRLSRAATAGRLTLDEFADRAGQVFAARTRDELDAVVADLPPDLVPSPAESDHEPDAATGPKRRRFVAVMSGSAARGRWWAPRRIRALAWWGGVKIDLREAVITTPVVDIKASAYMGKVSVVVPDGIPVDMSGLVLMGGASNRTRSGKVLPGAPVVRVRARGLWGGVSVRSASNPSPGDLARKLARAKLREKHRWASSCGTATGAHHEPSPTAPDRDGSRPGPDGGPGSFELTPGSQHDAIPRLDDLHLVAGSTLRDKLRAAADLIDTRLPDAGTASDARFGGTAAGPAEPAMPAAQGDMAGRDGRDGEAQPGPRLPIGTVTILVTDMVRSTELAQTLGDQRWMEVLRTHNQLVRAEVAVHGGTEVKSQGDGFIMVFPSARAAILAAVDVQRTMGKYRADNPEHDIELRVGLHTGEVVVDDDDIHGQNVVTAVRIADAAAPGEILVSGITRELTASSSDLTFDGGRDLQLKGLTDVRRVHPIIWE